MKIVHSVVVRLPFIFILPIFLISCGKYSTSSTANKSAQEIDGKIIGGRAVEVTYYDADVTKAWGSAVALVKNGVMFCTGTLVAPKVVISAAHCLEGENANDIKIYVGNGKEKGKKMPGQYDVAWFKINPLYLRNLQGNADSSLIVLKQADGLVPIVPILQDPEEIALALHPQNKVTLVGFGTRNLDDDSEIGRKFQVETKIHQRNSDEIVVGEVGKDSCFGDSGGPAFVKVPGKGWRVFGITSRGLTDGCADAPAPGVYGLMHNSLCWMDQELSQHSDSQNIRLVNNLNLCMKASPYSNSPSWERKETPLCSKILTQERALTMQVLKRKLAANTCGDLELKLKKIKKLNLNNDFITDISLLSTLNQLEKLDLSENRLKNLEGLEKLSQLKTLDITWNDIAENEIQRFKKLRPDVDVIGERLQKNNYFKNRFLDLCENRITPRPGEFNTVVAIKMNSPFNSCEDTSRFVQSQKSLELVLVGDQNLSVLTDFSELQQLEIISTNLDLSPLAQLKNLSQLKIVNYAAADLSFLNKNKKLTHLILKGKEPLSYSFLSELPNLRYLSLSFGELHSDALVNAIKDNLTLSTLSLEKNKLTNSSFLNFLPQLISLNLANNKLTEIPEILSLKNLKSLNLGHNSITDLGALSELTKLENISLAGLKLADYNFLNSLNNLASLDLSNSNFAATGLLQNKAQLRKLVLDNSEVTADSLLGSNLIESHLLKELSLEGLTFTNLKFLKGLSPSVLKLNLQNNKLTTLEGAKELTGCHTLLLSSNPLKGFQDLKEMKELEQLRLSSIGEINLDDLVEHLKTLPKFSALSLSNNTLSDAHALLDLKELEVLDLSNNQLEEISYLKDLKDMVAFWGGENPLEDKTCPWDDPLICRDL